MDLTVKTEVPKHKASSICTPMVSKGFSSIRPSTIITSYFYGPNTEPMANSANGISKNTKSSEVFK